MHLRTYVCGLALLLDRDMFVCAGRQWNGFPYAYVWDVLAEEDQPIEFSCTGHACLCKHVRWLLEGLPLSLSLFSLFGLKPSWSPFINICANASVCLTPAHTLTCTSTESPHLCPCDYDHLPLLALLSPPCYLGTLSRPTDGSVCARPGYTLLHPSNKQILVPTHKRTRNYWLTDALVALFIHQPPKCAGVYGVRVVMCENLWEVYII